MKMRHNEKLDFVLRGIVMTRGDSGATIAEMRAEYFNMFCEKWPLQNLKTDHIVRYLIQIEGLVMVKCESGPCIWYIDDLGSSLSDQDVDSNNNITTISNEMELTEPVTTVPSHASNHETTDNSYKIRHFRSRPNLTPSLSTVSAETLHFDSSLENDHTDLATKKRPLSQNTDATEHVHKRLKPDEANRLPLIEKNLDIHNRKSGANEMVKQVTSTEKESSMSVQSVSNPSVEIMECTESIVCPCMSKEQELKQLRADFSQQCQINGQPKYAPNTNGMTEPSAELIPLDVAILADDFMLSLISIELYGSDFSRTKDKRFSYCQSGLTIQRAFCLVFDRQDELVSKYNHVIVNIGALDILLERDLIDIQVDFARLMRAFDTIGCRPIITTIPEPYINPTNLNQKSIKQTLLLFNRFLVEMYGDKYPVIDLYSSFKEIGSIYKYQKQPKYIYTNLGRLELRCWSNSGRKVILQEIATR